MSDNGWEQFIEACQSGYDRVKREVKEVEMLIEQTSAEVERLMQANSHAVARARQIETIFDTVPREDIKKTYDSLLENQQRLFTMRGQLEKLQSDQRNMSRLAELYREIMAQAHPAGAVTTGRSGDEIKPSQAMVVSIIEAQEQERLRLSRQMHDGPAQSLTNLVLQAEICERLFDRDPERARAELAELKNNVVNAFKSVKTFIFDLRPMMLDDLGLVPTIRRYVQSITDEGFAGLNLRVTGKERRLPPHTEVTIFRVIQSLIHVGRDQSQATAINISLDVDEDRVRVTVEDNGNGFELDEALDSPDAGRLGLTTIRERIEMLGGELHARSALAQGLNVTFTLPVPPP